VQLFDFPRSQYIYGTLSDHELSEDVSYECFSYVWGTAHTGSLIWLDIYMLGTYMIEISDNLDMALRCLQHQNEPRMLWVDFVCINQDDYDERKQQVQIMYRIFSKAEKVIAYLGDEADGSERLPNLLRRINDAHFKDAEDQADSDKLFIQPWVEEDWVRLGLPPSEDEAWLILEKFISRPWFVRVWIMQEALAAKELVVICGQWLVPALNIFKLVKIASARRLPFSGKWSQSGEVYQQPAACGLRQFHLLLELGLCGILGGDPTLDSDSWSLIDILERSRHASSTDPRDRVFALLNLCKDDPPLGLLPDYTTTVADTYKTVARALVMAGKGHRVLCNALLSDTVLGMPSWVPDWSLQGLPFEQVSPSATCFDRSGEFKAGGTDHAIRVGHNPDELVLVVYGIDHVHMLGEIFEYQEDPPLALRLEDGEQPAPDAESLDLPDGPQVEGAGEIGGQTEPMKETSSSIGDTEREQASIDEEWSKYPNLFRYIATVLSFIRESPKYKDDEIEIIWRTMICDRELGTQRKAPAGYDEYFRSYFETVKFCYAPEGAVEPVLQIQRQILDSPFKDQIKSLEQLRDLVHRCLAVEQRQAGLFQRAARIFCFSMRAAITSTGFVGMVPHRTQRGDVVVVIKGVSVPMVLRLEGEDRFKVVGQAYFHGFMDGEVFEMDDMKEEEIRLV
jgi:Heterokaryon incompatibility protein (HET)